MNKVYEIDPCTLERLYSEQQLTLQETADYYGCSREVIRARMVEFGIKRRTRTLALQTQRSRDKMSSIMVVLKHRDNEEAVSRFSSKYIVSENGCWEWRGHTCKGYGGFSFQGKEIQAHCFSYEYFKGPIPKGLHLDHLCRNRKCINPDHLEPVTPRENLRRGESPNWKTNREGRCKHGHDMSNPKIRKNGTKTCRECANQRWRESYYRRKEMVTNWEPPEVPAHD